VSNLIQPVKKLNRSQAATIMAIELDGKTYYLPQVDLITFESTHQLLKPGEDGQSVATIEIADQLVPIYCLSKDFELLKQIPDKRKVCIISGYKDRRFGFLCDNIQKLSYSEIRFEPVPACMSTENSPLSSLFLFRQEVGGIEMGMMLRSQSLLQFLDNSHQSVAA